jgi:RHS repeat-associated protein
MLGAGFAASADASTTLSGQINTTAPLVIDPSSSPSDPFAGPVSITSAPDVAIIQSMPVTKTINAVTLGDLANGSGCTSNVVVGLTVRESSTGDISRSTRTVNASQPVALSNTPSKVTWQVPAMTLRAGYAYAFRLSWSSGCSTVTQTTWAHNGATVDAGPATCTQAVHAAPTGSSQNRMWHVNGRSDGSSTCLFASSNSFDPSMPTGWLETSSAFGWVYTAGALGPQPSVDSACGTNAGVSGVQVTFWRHSPTNPDASFWVCLWPQFAPPNVAVPDGWYYGLPWRTDHDNSAPRDAYIKLNTAPSGPAGSYFFGGSNPGGVGVNCNVADPVDCATGNFWEAYRDFHVAGLSPNLDLARTYNAQAAVAAMSAGRSGYGWSSSYSDSLTVDQSTGNVTVHQANGSTVPFSPNDSGGYAAPGWVHATLGKNDDGSYTYVLPDHSRSFSFDSSGKLQSEADRNGNSTTLGYGGSGNLTTITDPAGRAITLSYNADGTVQQATDPAGHTVHYAYDSSGNLTDVTDVGGGVTHFAYDAAHRMTSVTDPRGHTVTTNVYDSSNRVTSQTDALNRTTHWDYGTPGHTKITDPAGHVTDEQFQNNLPVAVTKAAGTASASTWSYSYDSDGNVVSKTDPNNHQWQYTYDSAGNRLSATDPRNRTTQWTYDADRNITSITTPSGRETDFAYDSHGNLVKITKTLTETGDKQVSTLVYNSLGELTQLTDPLTRSWSYGYDSQGDRTSITTPLGHRSSASFDQDSSETSSVSARGNEPGANPADYTTTYTRDPFGRPTDVQDPQGHHQLFSYDADGNLTDATDRDGNHTQYSYDAANQQTQVTRGDGSTQKTSYDADGQVSKQTDGLNHDTSYGYDAQERLSSITDPLNRQTSFGYDGAGNRTSLTDALGHTTTYGYDAADELTSIHYSTGNPQDVALSYNQDGDRASMTDASGTTSYAYDSLGRLTSQTNGGLQQVTYGYDLADELTGIGYPDALTALDLTDPLSQQQHVQEGTVTRSFDDDGNLASVTDWLNNKTTFGYDADANLTGEQRPNGTAAAYGYDRNDAITSIDDATGHTDYGRTPEELLSSATPPGQTQQSYGYDGTQRLTSAGSASYIYDAADNLTQTVDASGQAVSQSFDAANELASQSVGGTTTNTFGYDQNGNRTSATDAQNNTTAYTYDQANQLIDYEGPDHSQPGQTASDQYVYDGDGLRQTKTQNSQLTNEVWDATGDLPLLIEDGPTAYITGPDGLPIEQITQDGTVRYYSHDQLGSTTALTNQAGDTIGNYQYDVYGQPMLPAPAIAQPFGYAGQYTDTETGLQYLRARYYDPQSGNMLTRDPLEAVTGAPYAYAADTPVNAADPSGQTSIAVPITGTGGAAELCAGTVEVPVVGEVTCTGAATGVILTGGAAAYEFFFGSHHSDPAAVTAPSTITVPGCFPSLGNLGLVFAKQQPASLSPAEQEAVANKEAGLPYDPKAYKSARQKQVKNEKFAGPRNQQKRQGG